MEKLTDRKINMTLASLTGDVAITDTSGMTVMFRKGVKKSSAFFYCRVRVNGKPVKIKIGTFPALSVSEARTEYLKIKGRVERGLPPREEVYETNDVPLGALWAEWFPRRTEGLKPRSVNNYTTIWNGYLSRYAKLPIRKIDVRWVDEHIYTLKSRTGTALMPLRAGEILNAMMTYAAAKGYIPYNPLTSLRAVAPKYRGGHRTAFKEDTLEEDMKELFAAAREKMEPEFFAALCLLFLSLLRVRELLGVERDGLREDGDLLYTTLETKTWDEFRVPFVPQAVCIIRWFLNRPAATGLLVTKGAGPMGILSLRNSLYGAGYRGKLMLHGIRACGRQWMAMQDDIKESTAELCLAHTIGDGTERAYNRGNYFEKRTVAMRRWADFVESCLPDGLTFRELFDTGERRML